MRIKWQWFLGGRFMFWASLIMFLALVVTFVFTFVLTYFIDLTSVLNIKVQDADSSSIEELSKKYLATCEITIDKPVVYRYVKYNKNAYDTNSNDVALLGTFHEWNDTYYIDILIDLKDTPEALAEVVEHETRHMIVDYLKDMKIVDLEKYTEEIARRDNIYYDELFNGGVYLLKRYQTNEGK